MISALGPISHPRSAIFAALCLSAASSTASAVTWSELSALRLPKADRTVSYGTAPAQTIDIRLPITRGSHPVAFLIHGGCWSNQFNSAYMSHWAAALCRAGWATFNIEYRRNEDAGGGWPGTLSDIQRATEYVMRHAEQWQLDLDHVIVVGHSAGGHLALLLAARDARITGVVGLAAITDLAAYQKEPIGCAEGARQFATAANLRAADPMQQPLPRARILLISGSADTIVPPRYAQTFSTRSPKILVKVWPAAGHFDLVAPTSNIWPALLSQVSQLRSDEVRRERK